jgi:hypothetical protein
MLPQKVVPPEPFTLSVRKQGEVLQLLEPPQAPAKMLFPVLLYAPTSAKSNGPLLSVLLSLYSHQSPQAVAAPP